ncbi:hypothetical protein KCU81_g2177, partial [Aureobasidium melanogenum]|uniref:BZIP domain-containing protein n=1 Tax=Aureobasidium melanogenum (strain CBS 110374) TaxID=1043003 RepID=A0A074VWG5_AURM1
MTPTAASLEKKRLRDRRAQHAARARRDTQLQALQQRVEQGDKIQAQLEVEVQQLRTALDTLRAENLQLRRQHTAAIELLSGSSELIQEGANGQISHHHSSPSLPQKQLDDCSPSSTWSRVPQNFPEDSLSASLMPWLLCPAVVTHLSDTPCGPDILYGSHTNPLSNAIHIAFSCALHGTLNDPERLALGYLTYIVSKWRVEPSQERFDRLPEFMRSTQLQTSQPHQAIIDGCIWPRMRDNLIEQNLPDAQIHSKIGYMISAMRLTWPKNMTLLRPRPDGELCIRTDFIQTFMRLENWSLTTEFVSEHSDMVSCMSWSPMPSQESPDEHSRVRIVPTVHE